MPAVRFASRGRRERSAARRAATSWSSAPTCPSFSAHSCTPKLGVGIDSARESPGLSRLPHGATSLAPLRPRVAHLAQYQMSRELECPKKAPLGRG
jgi:hypothetical protein